MEPVFEYIVVGFAVLSFFTLSFFLFFSASYSRSIFKLNQEVHALQVLIAETRGQMGILKEAPVLRQYIQKIVPIREEDEEEARKYLEKKMRQWRDDLEKSMGFDPLNNTNSLNDTDFDPEDMV